MGVHDWDYRYDTGVSEYDNHEVLTKFTGRLTMVTCSSMKMKLKNSIKHPQPFNRDEYLGSMLIPHHKMKTNKNTSKH